jgi:hypothetical protein
MVSKIEVNTMVFRLLIIFGWGLVIIGFRTALAEKLPQQSVLPLSLANKAVFAAK